MGWWRIFFTRTFIAATLVAVVMNEHINPPLPVQSVDHINQSGMIQPMGALPGQMGTMAGHPQMGAMAGQPLMGPAGGQVGPVVGQPVIGSAAVQIGHIIGHPSPQAAQGFLNMSNSGTTYGTAVNPMNSYTATGAAAAFGIDVELSIRVANLPEPDILGNFDPLCVTYTRPLGNNEWMEIHKTEAIHNNTHPEFTEKPTISYSFGEKQELRFKIINNSAVKSAAGAKGPKAEKDPAAATGVGGAPKAAKATTQEKDDSLGYAECNMGELMTRGRMTIKLRKRSATGQEITTDAAITVVAEKIIGNNDEVRMVFKGNLNQPIDGFIEIYKSGETTDKSEFVLKTEIVMETMTPTWKPIELTVRNLCNGNYHRPLKFVFWDWGSQRGKRQILGEFPITLHQLMNLSRREFMMPTGTLSMTKFSVISVPTIADFIRGGLQINCSVAIDFTSENGDKNTSGTLHYLEPTGTNQYEEALYSVVRILEDYDYDSRFQVYGFGGKYHPDGPVLFNFNINPNNMDSFKTQGVLDSYRNCLRSVYLSKPGFMSLSIEKVIENAKNKNPEEHYHILLILTHGIISDIDLVEKAITEASNHPISIIIVGIGDNATDFADMRRLDADHLKEKVGANTTPKPTTGAPTTKTPRRDIVQFIKFNQFRSYNTTPGEHRAGSYLAKQVLAEVPNQLVSFMRSKGLKPKTPIFNNALLPGQPVPPGANAYGVNPGALPNFQGGMPSAVLSGVPSAMPAVSAGTGMLPNVAANPGMETIPNMGGYPNHMGVNPYTGMTPNMGFNPHAGINASHGMPQSYTSMESFYPQSQNPNLNVYPPPPAPASQYGHMQVNPHAYSAYGGVGAASSPYATGQINTGVYPPTSANSPYTSAYFPNNASTMMPGNQSYNPGGYRPHY